ncbi:class D sortase [Bacillus sp. Marseille-Q1617]|uniref:class D sortase n=1 Tax=Bacillus sp. Marseille-Q1617 TaxID=2736887 RepID=UPI00158D3176|nr:class D sortase [Bacillus sp. Marseille-Q1617]
MKINFLKAMSVTLLIGGGSLLGYSGYHLAGQEMKEKRALEDAHEIVKAAENKYPKKAAAVSYSFSEGEVVGILSIPKLKKKLPVIEGTQEEELEKGVGHYSDTKLPGQGDRIFLAGHRDTVFKSMGEIEKGDLLEIQLSTGHHRYVVFEMFVVNETDLSVLESTSPNEILTLSTCYPFEYLSSTEERYIINARRID